MQNLSRRALLAGSGATALLTACPLCAAGSPFVVKNVLCAARALGGQTVDEIFKTTGDAVLDKGLISEMLTQSAFYGLRPAFALYDAPEKNAFATPDVLPDYPGTDGTICYHLQWLRDQLKSSQWGGLILAGVIAHEFGHIYQFKTAYYRTLLGYDRTTKFVELHADFLSGFYLGGKFAHIDMKDYADYAYRIGDSNFTEVTHHGTPPERYLATKAGFNLRLGNRSLGVANAAREGDAFLKEYIHATP